MQGKIKTGFDIKNLGWGVGCFLFGIAAILAGAIGNITLRIGGFVLPVEVMYIVGAVFMIGGVLLSRHAFRTDKCVACNKALEQGEAFFKTSERETVLDAVRRLDATPLLALDRKKKDKNAIVLSLAWCPQCAAVGRLEVESSEDYTRTTLVAEHFVEGAGVDPFAELVAAHETERDDD